MPPRTVEEIKGNLVDAARSREGKPFRHHFKPENSCNYGQEIIDSCWAKGLDDTGYDCSGLVIASLCDVLEITIDKWPRNARHIEQFIKATSPDLSPGFGDIIITVDDEYGTWHMGVCTEGGNMVHASGHEDVLSVVEGPINPNQRICVVRQVVVPPVPA